MAGLGSLVLPGLVLLAFLPAAVLRPVRPGAPSPRRDDVALSAAVVLVLLAVVVTLFGGYMAIVLPPFLSFWLSAAVAGLAGRHPFRYGPGAAAAYLGVVAGFAVGNLRADPATVAAYAAASLGCGVAGAAPAAGLMWLRGGRPGGV